MQKKNQLDELDKILLQPIKVSADARCQPLSIAIIRNLRENNKDQLVSHL